MDTLFSWSSGKDSAWALHVLSQQPDVRVVGLVTTFNEAANRVAMHAVRRELVEAQADALGIPLWPVMLPWPCSNEEYEGIMRGVCTDAVARGVKAVAFGDLFLEDVRQYRERQLAGTGLEPLFPVWQIPTDELARTMISAGLKARITCVDPSKLPAEFAGREFDESFLRDLPPGVDPCGEKGEFHSFVYDGPGFRAPLRIESGIVVERDGFVFADVLPERAAA
jgi:uncharacterized protein (TIGR00290 family)